MTYMFLSFNAKGKIQLFDLKLAEPFEVTNNFDPDQATMVAFPDTRYSGRFKISGWGVT